MGRQIYGTLKKKAGHTFVPYFPVRKKMIIRYLKNLQAVLNTTYLISNRKQLW